MAKAWQEEGDEDGKLQKSILKLASSFFLSVFLEIRVYGGNVIKSA